MSPKLKVFLLLGGFIVAAGLAVTAVFSTFVKLAEKEFVPGKEVYLRDVYVIIDQTLSMAQGQRHEARDIVKTEILNSLGIGDRIACYRINSSFQETSDRVFTSTRRLPKVFDNLNSVAVSDLPQHLRDRLGDRWTRFAEEKAGWLRRLETLDNPGGRYSDYLGALEEISRRITDDSDPNLADEKWLIVVGDLKHEPLIYEPPPSGRNEKRRFANVNIFMVYPGGVHDAVEQERIESFWKHYFSARGNQKIHFLSYDGFTGRFPMNTMPTHDALRLAR